MLWLRCCFCNANGNPFFARAFIVRTIQRTIHILMLAVAGAGSIPLWMHHATEHASCSTAEIRSDAQTVCAGHSHATASRQSVTEQIDAEQIDAEQIDAEQISDASPGTRAWLQHDDHDCSVCFNLAQTPNPALTLAVTLPTLVFDLPTPLSASPFAPLISCPPPARGPPCVS